MGEQLRGLIEAPSAELSKSLTGMLGGKKHISGSRVFSSTELFL